MNLEQVIRNHVSLPHKTNKHGWYPVLCKVCRDHGKKGKRAGFKFENSSVGYNCFNCGHSAIFDPMTFDPNLSKTLSRDMVTVLDAYGISKDEWQPIIFELLANGTPTATTFKKRENYEPSEIEFPEFFTPIDEAGDDFDLYAIEYLKNERGVDWKQHPFLIGRKTDHPSSKRWYGRLIIPIFKDGKLIFYQGRDLSDTHVKKYINPDISRENVLYGYENISKETEEPLYIVEGWFDAWHLNGVAVLGSKMSPHQLHWINRSRRPKVIIPDRYGDGHLLAEQGLELGWSVSTPDWGSDVKDTNEAIMCYGKVFTMMSIRNHISTGYEASVRLKIFCEIK